MLHVFQPATGVPSLEPFLGKKCCSSDTCLESAGLERPMIFLQKQPTKVRFQSCVLLEAPLCCVLLLPFISYYFNKKLVSGTLQSQWMQKRDRNILNNLKGEPSQNTAAKLEQRTTITRIVICCFYSLIFFKAVRVDFQAINHPGVGPNPGLPSCSPLAASCAFKVIH